MCFQLCIFILISGVRRHKFFVFYYVSQQFFHRRLWGRALLPVPGWSVEGPSPWEGEFKDIIITTLCTSLGSSSPLTTSSTPSSASWPSTLAFWSMNFYLKPFVESGVITPCSWLLKVLLMEYSYVQTVNHFFIPTDHDPYDVLWVVYYVLEYMG